MHELPFTCYAALAETLTKYPKTIEAFRSGLHEGIALATTDRPKVENALVKYKLARDAQVAKLINLVGFNRSTDPQRARRDAELMAKFGLLKGPLDFVNDMVVPRADDPAVSTRGSK